MKETSDNLQPQMGLLNLPDLLHKTDEAESAEEISPRKSLAANSAAPKSSFDTRGQE